MKLLNVLPLILLTLSVLNFFTIKSLKPNGASENYDFEILVPLRNEENNVIDLIRSLRTQGGRILALDDNSTDRTRELLREFGTEITVLEGKELPNGWLGKNFACHQLAVNSNSKYLVFIDADVRLKDGAITTSIAYLEEMDWDFISPYPKQKTSGILQFIIQPLLQWSWFATVPFFLAYRRPNKSMAVANGQFFIVKRDAYLVSGGHKQIKSEVLDDIELARALIAKGHYGGPVDGSKISSCHMYQTDKDLISGYTKSLWRAFGSPLGSFVAILFSAAMVLPFLYFSFGALLLICSRLFVAMKVRSNPISAFLHPIAMFALIILIITSNVLHKLGRLSWRGRAI